MSVALPPLTFAPQFRDYLWGGRNLEMILGRALPPGIVAESWEISGHPSAPTVVDGGPLDGRALPELLAEYGQALVGRRSREMLTLGRFPLLVKLLDAQRDLSVQVHPDDAYARAHGDDALGKAEMWVVLHAAPGAELICGLAPGATREALRAALEEGDPGPLLRRMPIAPGDAVHLPAGTVHALLAGALVAEIQQNSDATYRLYDWGRLGADGRPRELHVDKALDVIAWDRPAPCKATPRPLHAEEGVVREALVSGDDPRARFTVERVTLGPGVAFSNTCDGETFEIWGVLAGSAEVVWAGAPTALEAVRFALLPATLGTFGVRAGAAGATALRVRM